MKLVFELSGEYEKIPYGEVKAVLDVESDSYSIDEKYDNVLLIDVVNPKIQNIGRRLALSHCILEHIDTAPSLKELLKTAESIDTDKTYSVRVKRVKSHLKSLEIPQIEKKIGKQISGKVNLDNPKEEYRIILSNGYLIMGRVKKIINKQEYHLRGPNQRPFFRPGAVKSKFARSVVNLVRPKKGDIFLDVFCGTGSYLLEASSIGIESIGVDANKEVIKGCMKNIKKFGSGASVVRADAMELPFKANSIDAIVLDPPYGRSSKIYGSTLQNLIQKSVKEGLTSLKDGGFMCLILPNNVNIDVRIDEIEAYENRVHASLSRLIRIYQK